MPFLRSVASCYAHGLWVKTPVESFESNILKAIFAAKKNQNKTFIKLRQKMFIKIFSQSKFIHHHIFIYHQIFRTKPIEIRWQLLSCMGLNFLLIKKSFALIRTQFFFHLLSCLLESYIYLAFIPFIPNLMCKWFIKIRTGNFFHRNWTIIERRDTIISRNFFFFTAALTLLLSLFNILQYIIIIYKREILYGWTSVHCNWW